MEREGRGIRLPDLKLYTHADILFLCFSWCNKIVWLYWKWIDNGHGRKLLFISFLSHKSARSRDDRHCKKYLKYEELIIYRFDFNVSCECAWTSVTCTSTVQLFYSFSQWTVKTWALVLWHQFSQEGDIVWVVSDHNYPSRLHPEKSRQQQGVRARNQGYKRWKCFNGRPHHRIGKNWTSHTHQRSTIWNVCVTLFQRGGLLPPLLYICRRKHKQKLRVFELQL